MRKMLGRTALALAAMAAAGSALAQGSSVTIAGRVDLGAQIIDNGAARQTRLDSGTYTASRLIFRGVEDLGNGMSAGFYLESRFNADVGAAQSSSKFWNAGTQVYLAHKDLGTLTLGRQYTPIFFSFLFADEAGPLRSHGYSAVNSVQRSKTARVTAAASPIKSTGSLDTITGGIYELGIGSTFEDNAVSYKSPEFGGLTVRLAAAAPEGSPAGSGRVLGASAEYRQGPFFGSVAHNRKRGTLPAGGGLHQTLSDNLVSGLYEVVPSSFKLWGNLHTWKLEDPSASLKGRDWMLGVSFWHRGGNGEFWLNYASKKIKACQDCDSSGLGIGYNYRLSKRTELYAAAARVGNGSNAANTLNGFTPAMPGKDVTGYALGLAATF